MKIVINALSARLGGGQTYLLNLLRHLPQKGKIEIFIYAPASLELPADSRITRLSTIWPTENPIARSIWEKLMLPKILKKLGADILFCPGGVLSTKPPAGCRSVTMFRNMTPFDLDARKQVPFGLQRIRIWMLEGLMLKSMAAADLVIYISDFARSVIEKRIKTKKAVTIPHGISEHFRTNQSSLAKPDFLPDGNYILYVSKFDVYKHHYEVVSAYDNLPDEIKNRFKLILIGESDTACGDRVRSLTEKRKLMDRVKIIGAVKYQLLPAVYQHAKLILFASSCENCPNILLEALGAGRPVLSSSVMPMPEFGGDAVAYFDPRNVGEITERIIDVLDNQALSDKLANQAALRSLRYDWEITAEKTWSSIFALS